MLQHVKLNEVQRALFNDSQDAIKTVVRQYQDDYPQIDGADLYRHLYTELFKHCRHFVPERGDGTRYALAVLRVKAHMYVRCLKSPHNAHLRGNDTHLGRVNRV